MKHQYIIPIFVPHLGCPNDCIFCNQKSISGQKKNMTKEEAKKIIDDYLENIKDKEAQIEMIHKYNRLEETMDKLVYYAEYIFEDEEEFE